MTRRARKNAPLWDRLLLHTEVLDNGCWEWRGAVDNGYGRMQVNGRTGYAHRVAYECAVGPIPDGLEIDHLCRNPACCNPDHLDAVTPATNNRRSPNTNANKTHCPSGHAYLDHGVVHDGRRYCRPCRIQRSKEWHQARRRLTHA